MLTQLVANHGVFIGQLNVDLRPKENVSALAEPIDSIEFTTDAIGSLKVLCSVSCGVGYSYVLLDGAFVVR